MDAERRRPSSVKKTVVEELSGPSVSNANGYYYYYKHMHTAGRRDGPRVKYRAGLTIKRGTYVRRAPGWKGALE